MTLREALTRGGKALAGAGIEDASLESELLLRHTLSLSRVRLYLELNDDLDSAQQERFEGFLSRRLRHEPSAYITGHCEFYGLDFYVDRRVLVPRSATELIVEEALAWARGKKRRKCRIAEAGVGSGVISVSIARHVPDARLYATDISGEALEVAGANCRRHGVAERVMLLRGDLLEPVPEPVDLVVANLPYIRSGDMPGLMPEIRLFEPAVALDGGTDGLDQIRRLTGQLQGKVRAGGCVLLEIGEGQGEAVTRLLRTLYPGAAVGIVPDWGGIDRVVRMTLPERARLRSGRLLIP